MYNNYRDLKVFTSEWTRLDKAPFDSSATHKIADLIFPRVVKLQHVKFLWQALEMQSKVWIMTFRLLHFKFDMPENLSRIIATAKKSKGEITLRSVTKDLQAEIERLRREMHELAMREGLNSQLVLQKSVELDKLINLYINSKKDNVWNSA